MQLVRDESGKITHIRVKSKEERKELDEVTTYIAQDIGRHMKGLLLPEGSVVVDCARFERLQECAKGWVSECDREGDAPNDAMIRVGLQPGDLDPLP